MERKKVLAVTFVPSCSLTHTSPPNLLPLPTLGFPFCMPIKPITFFTRSLPGTSALPTIFITSAWQSRLSPPLHLYWLGWLGNRLDKGWPFHLGLNFAHHPPPPSPPPSPFFRSRSPEEICKGSLDLPQHQTLTPTHHPSLLFPIYLLLLPPQPPSLMLAKGIRFGINPPFPPRHFTLPYLSLLLPLAHSPPCISPLSRSNFVSHLASADKECSMDRIPNMQGSALTGVVGITNPIRIHAPGMIRLPTHRVLESLPSPRESSNPSSFLLSVPSSPSAPNPLSTTLASSPGLPPSLPPLPHLQGQQASEVAHKVAQTKSISLRTCRGTHCHPHVPTVIYEATKLSLRAVIRDCLLHESLSHPGHIRTDP
ncbi:hypothetical protein IE53DRAFT_104238 [Violaceomyces palustris]|uniref:Uncharacterized protein n=1 Tax=Violaceomyces palustris TaxID=1673888 RepID=A0ACD0P709_9BASI|nr:hypothetical protein IE53DRAFT_104238 [Violaceomyces palustris]